MKTPHSYFAEKIIELLKEVISEKSVLSKDLITTPPDVKKGDFTYPCFELAKIKGISPAEIALEIVKQLKPTNIIINIQAEGPYINFFISPEKLNEYILNHTKEEIMLPKKNKTVMIEYSGPNPCKTFHMGHFRNTTLGIVIVNLYRYLGYKVIPVNFLNDTGMHMAKVIWLYLRSYNGKEPKEKKGKWLGELYVEANTILDEDPTLAEEVHKIHRKIEEKDKQTLELLEKFKDWSQIEFDRIYDQLGAEFDEYFYDSDYIESGKEIVKELVEKKIAHKSEGAIVVDLEKYGLPTALILKTDGTAVYITKDFAMAKDRFENYNVDKLIYVVGAEQNLNFKQLFKILELYGFENAKDCLHLSYELVNTAKGKKMSTRKGTVIFYSEIFTETYNKAFTETKKRHQDWDLEKQQKTAEIVALAAMKYGMLKYDINKKIDFDIDKSLDLNGDTGPYILYTIARIYSILKKSEIQENKIDYSLLKTEEEKELIAHIAKMHEVIKNAGELHKPSLLAHYTYELAKAFNHFYHEHSVINSDDQELKKARIELLKTVKNTFKYILKILGIEWVEKM